MADDNMIEQFDVQQLAYLAGELPEHDNATHFLIWFIEWQEQYLTERGKTFEKLYTHKRLRLGASLGPAGTAA